VKKAIEQIESGQKALTLKYSGVDTDVISKNIFKNMSEAAIETSNKNRPLTTNVTFGNVTINSGHDIQDIADKVSESIANAYRRKGL
jgi:hypothetical protein